MKPGEILAGVAAMALLAVALYFWMAPAGLKHTPDIVLVTVDGEQLALSSLRGSPLLVTFWATTCPSCLREMPHLVDLYNELSPQGLNIIGIAMHYDPPNRVLAMRESRQIPYPVALDIHADAARAFGNVRVTPTTFLIAPDGRVVYLKSGRLDIEKLRQRILALLNDAQAGIHHPARNVLRTTHGERIQATCSGSRRFISSFS